MSEHLHPRSFDWISLLILEVMFLACGLSILAADWTDHLSVILAVGALAVWAGAALGHSRFSPKLASLFAGAYGAFVVASQIGGTLDRALSWPDRLSDLVGRLGIALGALARGDASVDPLIFVLFLAAIFWIFGVIAGWAVFRRQGLWTAVIPAGVAILINAYFYAGEHKVGQGLAVYALVSLLLAARLELRRREEAWRRKWSQVSSDVAYHVGRAGVLAAFALVVLAWGGPAFAQSKTAADLWAKAGQPWDGLKERLGKALNSLHRPSTPVFDAYADTLSLGAGTSLPDTVVLRVRLAQPPTPTTRLYWQTRKYEVYGDGRWEMGPGEELSLTPEQNELPLIVYAQRDPIEAWIQPSLPAIRVLPVPGQTVWVNRTVTADVRTTGQGVVDIVRLSADDLVRAGETYHLWGWATDPTADVLRDAGTKYPSWVVPETLQLPPTVTDRTRELAQTITQGLDNPYDKAQAITDWLRENIQYSRETIAPPAGQDPIDWFLFDYRTGYCNFYASAEVVMLRSLGIPSRLAVGYASGEETSRTTYEVRADDAHAWPEVFFPDIGWVQFEPTASQPPLVRAETSENTQPEVSNLREFDPLAARPNLDRPETTPMATPRGGSGLLWLGLAVLLIGGGVVWLRYNPRLWASASYVLVRGLRRVGVRPPAALEKAQQHIFTDAGQIYASWTEWFDRLGARLTPTQTPYERAQAFAQAFPSDGETAWSIVRAYTAERFGQIAVDVDPVRDAWRELHLRMMRRWLQGLFGRLSGGAPTSPLVSGANAGRRGDELDRPGSGSAGNASSARRKTGA
jgi:transglutaminase-like putative cysteine protease